MQLASVALALGVPYEGADFRFSVPEQPAIATKPSLRIIGTGKRTGKTSIGAYAARTLVAAGRRPVIVAMGRGGPQEPEVLMGDQIELTVEHLVELADSGRHAASDYIEDAYLARVPTVGCHRCGGGMAGGVAISNVGRGVEIANGLAGDLLILEGSGSALPPVAADATCLVVPSTVELEFVRGYLGGFRLLIADLVVVTMCEEPFGSPSQISTLSSLIRSAWRTSGTGNGNLEEIRVVRTVFRPKPTGDVEGARVFVVTTAPGSAGEQIRRHLELEYRCRVVGISHSLSDRAALERELEGIGGRADVLLCEIKAAAVDVATRRGLESGLDVMYMDNVPEGIEGDDPQEAIEWLGRLAADRFGR
jgi:cyclic 2,3-diphosphoglycerate synthetase